MKKIIIFIASLFISLSSTFYLNHSYISADSLNNNTEIAKNILIQDGYSELEATKDLQSMAIQNEGELIGIDIFSKSEQNIPQFRAARQKRTYTYYLNRKTVKTIFSNFNAVDKGSYILGILIGYKNPILGAIIGAGGFQNPNLRNAITKAYYQGKRVKVVTEYGISMSLDKTYYYVVN